MSLDRVRNVLLLLLAAAVLIRLVAWLITPAIPLLVVLFMLVVVYSFIFTRRF
jgi:uncharacterized protein YqgC (DUF456 family)